jgi:hypothetical protein
MGNCRLQDVRALDAEKRMRELLAGRGVAIAEDGCGDAAGAPIAWEAFKPVAAESVAEHSAYDDGTEVLVEEGTDADLLHFEFSVLRRNEPQDKWVKDPNTLPATGLDLSFRRQFSFRRYRTASTSA